MDTRPSLSTDDLCSDVANSGLGLGSNQASLAPAGLPTGAKRQRLRAEL